MTRKAAHHDLNGRKVNPVFAGRTIQVVLLAQLPRAVEPAERALHDPAFGLHHEAAAGQPAHDLDHHLQPLLEPADRCVPVARVGPDPLQAWDAPPRPLADVQRAFRI